MAVVMLAIGIFLGFGPAFLVGYFGLSWWWIVLLATAALLFNKPITLYNSLRTAWRNNHFARGLIYGIVIPVSLQSAVLSIFFALGFWLGGD